jgi:hypothetical protein
LLTAAFDNANGHQAVFHSVMIVRFYTFVYTFKTSVAYVVDELTDTVEHTFDIAKNYYQSQNFSFIQSNPYQCKWPIHLAHTTSSLELSTFHNPITQGLVLLPERRILQIPTPVELWFIEVSCFCSYTCYSTPGFHVRNSNLLQSFLLLSDHRLSVMRLFCSNSFIMLLFIVLLPFYRLDQYLVTNCKEMLSVQLL